MAISQDKAQELCSKTEWDTVENSFPPRVGELTAAVLKKQANRTKRFLDKEKAAPGADGRVALFEEALERFEAGRAAATSEGEDDAKLAARREKEKAASERKKSVRDQRVEVRTKLKEKADKEKAEKEGESADEGKEKSGSNKGGVRGSLQAAGKRTQGKIGMRKV